jgi:phage shock protein C
MKRLYLGREKVIAGVCSGLADYLIVDPMVVRIGFVIFTLVGGSGILAYIIAMIVLPEQRDHIDDL